MTPAWFRYERYNGRWSPVVYHGDKPKVWTGEEDRHTAARPVPADCLASDGSPMFGRLQTLFPIPVERPE